MMSDGVGASSIHLPAGPWRQLLDFLDQRFPGVGREIWQARMRGGKVLSADGATLDADSAYRAGSVVRYYRELPDEKRIPFEATILHRDEHLLVVDKPHFLPTMPAGRYVQESLLVRLKRDTGLQDLVPLHRLDRGTAGLVMFSLNPSTRSEYSALFAQRRIDKSYEALAPTVDGMTFPILRRSRIVEGEPFFRMQETAGEPNAETSIERVETLGAISRYRLRPLTGRKHQLRVHLAALGLPILNDRSYPQLLADEEDDYQRPLKLLAKQLAFRDPLSGESRVFESQFEL